LKLKFNGWKYWYLSVVVLAGMGNYGVL